MGEPLIDLVRRGITVVRRDPWYRFCRMTVTPAGAGYDVWVTVEDGVTEPQKALVIFMGPEEPVWEEWRPPGADKGET